MSPRLIERARAGRRSNDAGMSLPELLVAMVLSTIIGAMTLLLVVKLTDATARTTDHTASSSEARNTIANITSELRVADGFTKTVSNQNVVTITVGLRANRIEWLTPNSMLFYADLGNRTMTTPGATSLPTMIWLRRDSKNELIEERFAGDATTGASYTLCRGLLRNLSGTAPLFVGLDSSYAPVSAGTAPTELATTTPNYPCVPLPVTPSSSRTPASTTTLQNVYAVTIDFTVTDSLGKHPIEFTSQAVLPSLGVVG